MEKNLQKLSLYNYICYIISFLFAFFNTNFKLNLDILFISVIAIFNAYKQNQILLKYRYS